MLKEEIQAIFMAEYGFKPTKKSIYSKYTCVNENSETLINFKIITKEYCYYYIFRIDYWRYDTTPALPNKCEMMVKKVKL